MKKEIYGAAAKGNVEFLQEALVKDVESATAAYSHTDFLGVTNHGNNIIHVAAQHGHLDFIVEALKSFEADDCRKLICGTNYDGDTPLHFAAIQRTQVMAHLIDFYGLLILPEDDKIKEASSAPWRIQNKDGNTPLHLALMNGGRSVRVARYLLVTDPEVAAIKNNRMEVPLHLAVTYHHQRTEKSSIEMINSLSSQEEELSTENSFFPHEYTSLSLVNSLLQKYSEAGCLCDADGMTPLLRAAVLSNLHVVDAIINACPESIEVCDPKRKNVLHYIRFPTFLAAWKFLEKPEVPVVLLIDRQDDDGNTPTHIAVMNKDFRMVRAMVEHNANFAIKNKEGVSVQTLFDQFAINDKLDVSTEAQIESTPNKFHDLIKFQEQENEGEVIKDELMSDDLYKEVGHGNLEIIREMLKDEKQYISRLTDGSNIIHLAIEGLQQHKYSRNKPEPYVEEELIVEALKKYPFLFSQTNRHWQTPLHLETFHLIWIIQDEPALYSKIHIEMMNLKEQGELALPPWKVKDLHGNSILHTAIKHANYEFAEYLIELDANLAGEVNHSKQTPLHLLCQRDLYFKQKVTVGKLLIEKGGSSAVYSRDVEGFTPLLRAAQHWSSYEVAIEIVKQHPQSIRQTDSHGRNFFHHLTDDFVSSLSELSETVVPQRELEILITQKDDQRNTPFDLAIEKRLFWKARSLIELSGDLQGIDLKYWLLQHKQITYRTIFYKGKTPNHFRKFLKLRGVKMRSWSYEGSTYGVGKEEIKEYMNPMGLVAALLATITFTAAFTVPGDYNDHGFPNLGKKAAFQVFMVMDVVAMCSSMMVLFCLLWFLSKDNTVELDYKDIDVQVKLVDISINLLQISFYATLIAFMTGVYVTTISKTPWLAIFTCVLCSFIGLLMRRSHIKMLTALFTIIPNDPSIIVREFPDIVRYCWRGTSKDKDE